jgi:sugar/nucleoside kinase (ribokinase family)
MNLLVFGHSVIDKIDYGKGKIIKPGGIFYTTAALANITESSDNIYVCTTIDKINEKLFSPVFKKIKPNYISYSANIPIVKLNIYNNKERAETYENVSGNLQFNISNLNRFDGILINMVSGFDLSLKQIKEIRKNYNGIIYFDVHTFSRGLDSEMKRNFRRITDFEEWAKCVDIIQANELEVKTLSSKTNEEEIARELIGYGVKQLIVTKGNKGAKVYFSENIFLSSEEIPAVDVKPVSKVGCGDVFGAVYFYNYIRNKNLIEALTLANIAAGTSTTYTDLNDYLNLKADVLARYNKA